MRSWKRITLVILILLGGTTSFGYWSINQFNQAFDDLSASHPANTYSAYQAIKQNAGLASTSPEISGGLATSTDKTVR